MQKPFVKWGLTAGGIGIAFTLILYIISPSMLNGFVAGLIPTIIMIYCAVKAAQEERELQGGYMTWAQALVPALLTILIYFVLTMLFSYILTNLIDPSLAEEQMKTAMEMQEKMMNLFGTEMTDEQIENLKESTKPSLMNTIMGMFWGLLCFGLPIAAIIALFVQKKDPENELLS
ncbi:MAG: DUF4199 domain-containing protein [Saprospiraceae bacterium]|nr:DUF4199 domain-containing protein [Saprospiraceae bacterium]